jgi:hypothetical protein
MAGIVDRLLAQLPGLQGQPEPPRSTPVRPGTYSGLTSTMTRVPESGQPQVIGMWIRVLLGLSLGVMMGWWPYSRVCGLPLLGYLGAVTTVMLAGTLAATASWRVRSGLAHTIALLLVFYGMMLAGSELLPRTGYAVDQATWTCQDAGSGPSLVLN